MPIYRYVKAKPPRPSRQRSLVISFSLLALGGSLLLWVAWPILSFTLVGETFFAKTVTPLSDANDQVKANGVLSPVVLAATVNNNTSGSVDYTNPNIWFPTSPQKKVVTPVNSYKVSIPALKIDGATAIIGGDDLSKSLVHYGGTALPGEYGNTVIFGHSTLPQFFNTKNYKTIFSTLPTLKIGDEILVDYDGIKYRYVIFEMVVTDPNDLTPLEQRFDDSYITLITCVPPGTYWKRLNVKARLVRYQ